MRQQDIDPDAWVDLRRGAEHAQVSIWTMYSAVAANQLQHVRVGGRKQIRTTRRWVDQWLRRYTVCPRAESGDESLSTKSAS